MRRIAFGLLLLLLCGPLAAGSDGRFVQQGSYLVGEPVAVLVADACTDRELDGVNSNCFSVPSAYRGRPFDLRARDDAGSIVLVSVCFYMAGGLISECDPADRRIPDWAEDVSVSSVGGVNVRWTFVAV